MVMVGSVRVGSRLAVNFPRRVPLLAALAPGDGLSARPLAGQPLTRPAPTLDLGWLSGEGQVWCSQSVEFCR